MKLLGIDHGKAHLGLAIGEVEGKVAVPLDTIHETDVDLQVGTVADIVAEEGIDEIVVGLPLTLDGDELDQAEETQAFVEALAERVSLPIHQEDERFSSEFAKRQKQEDPDGKFDEHALAAAAILQTYLEKA